MGDFEIESVLYFIISKGCRVRNHELVTHFKNFLNHPINKAQNREKFKGFVNELATIKLDAGEKVLVLKKKYRPPSEDTDFSLPSFPSYPTSHPVQKPLGGTKKVVASEPDLLEAQSFSSSTPAFLDQEGRAQNDLFRAHSEPPNGIRDNQEEEDYDSKDGMMSKVRSDDNLEMRIQNTERIPPTAATFQDNISKSGSNLSLASAGSQKSHASSTSGVASMDEDANASVISVKDKIKKLNKNISESDITQPKTVTSNGTNKKNYKHAAGDGDDETLHSSGSFVALDEEQRDWMVVCSYSEYHEMNRLLSKNPGLAKLKDFTNYTALHWAAKNGKAEVIKLVANKPGVYVDQRSGYTALHLAAIHGQEHIIELLVQTYKADPNLRDYSGKKAKQYLKNSASSKATHSAYRRPAIIVSRPESYLELLSSRRIGSGQNNVKILDDSFIRSASMRMSNRAKAMSTLLQVKSAVARQPILRSSWNGSSNDGYDDKQLKTPPGSTSSSPGSARKKSSRDGNLMPPPSESLTRRMHQTSRMKSTSRDTSPSSRHSKDDNKNFTRSGSDSALLEKSSTSTVV